MHSYKRDNVRIMVNEERAHLTVSNDSGDDNKVLEVTNDDIIESERQSIFWSYPVGVLTITFKANSDSTQPFDLHLEDLNSIPDDIELYRITKDGDEDKIYPNGSNEETARVESDCSNQCKVKVVGTSTMKYYGVNISYSIQKK